MALRNGTEHRLIPYGVCDCVDGTNAPAGAMKAMANLIPDPSTHGVAVPRPAAVSIVDFVAGGFASPGFISSQLVVGDTVYGTIASTRNAAKDEPFAYNLSAGSFRTVAGIVSGNVPTSPVTSGAWTPPVLAQVGSRIIVTHPGFPGAAVKFGWFDVSGFSVATTGNTNTSTLISGNPSILGVQPGMTITGTDIPANTTVVSTADVTLVETGATHTNTTIDGLPVSAARAVGQTVAGAGIPSGTTVTVLASATSVTISQATTASATVSVTFGGATITLSAAATGSTGGVTLTIAGGTVAAPLWGAGDTDINNLLSVPVGVAQFNGRAYYALGTDGIRYSDSGFPCRVSDTIAVQALTTNDGLAVTAIAPLLLSAPLTGGIVQALIAFEGATKMQQITGDQAVPATSTSIASGGLSTLTMNALPVATGTLAPLSIFSCDLGTGFISPQGLRFIQFDGSVSPPVGDQGKGVVVPFIFSVVPSRICAAANQGVCRATTQNGASSTQTQPQEEYWFDLRRKFWTGPHTSTASLIQPWRTSFLMSFIGTNAALFQSDSEAGPASTYVEQAAQLTWSWETSLLPDSGSGSMVALVDMTLACELAAESVATVGAISDFGGTLDTTTITGPGTVTNWGAFNWGGANWGAQGVVFRQRSVDWHVPLEFKQMQILVQGQSAFNVRVGNLYMKYQKLGYKLEEAA